MDALPIRLLGQSRQATLHAALGALASAWLRDWRGAPGEAGASVGVHALAGVGGAWLRVASGDAQAAIRLPTGGGTALAHWLLGSSESATEADALLAGVGRRALVDLAGRLVGVEAPHATETDGALLHGDPRFLGRHGAAHLTLEFDGLTLAVVLDDGAVCRLSPAVAATTAVALTDARQLLGAQRLALRVTLSLGTLSAGELGTLRVGETLVSSVPLDAAFELTTPEGDALAQCRLGRQGARRAIRLIDPTPTPIAMTQRTSP